MVLTDVEGDINRLVLDQLGSGGPPLGDELIRVLESPLIPENSITRDLHNGVSRNKLIPNPHALRGGHPLGAGRDWGVETHDLVNNRVEQIHSHQIVMFDAWKRIKLSLEALDEDGVPCQVEEGVCQGCGHAVTARDDDELGVTMQIPPVSLGFGALVVCGENPGEDVWLLRLFLWIHPC